MLKHLRISLVALLSLSVALAGCATEEGGDDTTPTPATEDTPTPTTGATPTTPDGEEPTPADATAITLLSAPARAAGNATVCWSVEGAGTVAHVAVHYDNESHPEATSFTDYDGGASYPGNETAAAAEGYELPGTFCTNVPVVDGIVYYRAHVIDAAGAPGMLSDEASTKPAGEASSVEITSFDADATAGEDALVCWRIEGEGNVAHVAVHYDNESHPEATSFTDYDAGAMYPDNMTSAAAAGYDLPGDFCANVTFAEAGTMYLRAHVIDRNGAPGTLSDEIEIEFA